MEKPHNQRITFSWDIHYACNYRCPYCWYTLDGTFLKNKNKNKNKYLPLKELIDIWADMYKRYGSLWIDIIGGEPFIYPNFDELIKELSKMHFIEVTSNLSTELPGSLNMMSPGMVRIAGTLHPLFADLRVFIKNLVRLKELGIKTSALYLAYPPQVPLIPYYKEKLTHYGIDFSVISFWGEYEGIRYPQGYSHAERNIIEPFLGERGQEKYQLRPKEVKNKMCRAGQVYVNLKADGSAYRCGSSNSQSLGNLFSGDFRLLDKPMPCNSDFCPCNEWADLLLET
jgi:MoaA/NifB/PqqE/SkfB family radical SAM enzyme